MPYTTLGKNLMMDAFRGTTPGTPCTHASLFTANTPKALTTPFGVASTDIFTSTAHGFSNADLVVLSGLTGGTGLTAGYPYFVITSTANTFQLALTPAGAAVDFTTDLSAGTVTRLVEISGGSPAYARKAIAYGAAAAGVIDDTTNGAVPYDVPGTTTVDWVGFNSAITAGVLLGVRQVTTESFAAQGTYTLTDAKLDLNL